MRMFPRNAQSRRDALAGPDHVFNRDQGGVKAFNDRGARYGKVKARSVLTSSANYANAETVTINGKVYTFQTVLTNVDGNIFIGASEAASMANLVNAINLGAGTPGTDYAAATTAHPTVTAATDAAHAVTVTSKLPGPIGNAYTISETSATASATAFSGGY